MVAAHPPHPATVAVGRTGSRSSGTNESLSRENPPTRGPPADSRDQEACGRSVLSGKERPSSTKMSFLEPFFSGGARMRRGTGCSVLRQVVITFVAGIGFAVCSLSSAAHAQTTPTAPPTTTTATSSTAALSTTTSSLAPNGSSPPSSQPPVPTVVVKNDHGFSWTDLIAPIGGLIGVGVGASVAGTYTRNAAIEDQRARAIADYYGLRAERLREALLALASAFSREAELTQLRMQGAQGAVATPAITAALERTRAAIAEARIRSTVMGPELGELVDQFLAALVAGMRANTTEERLSYDKRAAELLEQIENQARADYAAATEAPLKWLREGPRTVGLPVTRALMTGEQPEREHGES